MRLTKKGAKFVAVATFEERAIPKSAKFQWNPKSKHWWTDDPQKAESLVEYADGTCLAELKGLAGQREERIEQSRATDDTIDVPVPDGLEYLPFQKAGISFILDGENTLLGDEMGLGKTVQVLGAINAGESIERVLIICPASLRLNWRNEAEKWLVRSFNIYVVENNDPIPAESNFIIINYDRLSKHYDSLMEIDFDLLAVDEAHYCKNNRAKRTKLVLGGGKGTARIEGIVSRAKKSVFMTGTPMPNKPIEMFGILNALDSKSWNSFWDYAHEFCAARKGRYGWDMSGASNLGRLQEKLRGSVMVRRRKKDVLTELPAKRRQLVELPTNGTAQAVKREMKAWEAHEEEVNAAQDAVDLAHASGDEEAYDAAVKALRLASQVAFAEMSQVRHETALAKAPKVIEYTDAMFEDGVEKIVLFAHHKDVIQLFKEHFGDESVVLTGDTKLEDRQAAIERFQADDTCKIFVGSTTAAGVGITLTAASTVVFAELDWVPANITQAEDRCHRIGQTSSVNVVHLVLSGSLDAKMAKALIRKQEIADQALDKDFVRSEVKVPTVPGEPSVRPKTYPKASDAERESALFGLRYLADRDQDRARDDNNRGYNKVDGNIGHQLAAYSELTDGQVWLAKRILKKYHRQLPGDCYRSLFIS